MTSTSLFFLKVVSVVSFFFNDTATTEIYTLSLHDALPISSPGAMIVTRSFAPQQRPIAHGRSEEHTSELQSPYVISYAVFCLKQKKNKNPLPPVSFNTEGLVPNECLTHA